MGLEKGLEKWTLHNSHSTQTVFLRAKAATAFAAS